MSIPSINPLLRKTLEQQAKSDIKKGIRTRFDNEESRATRFSFQQDGLFFDFSKTHVSEKLLESYVEFAQQQRLDDKRHALFSGRRINVTEDRSVLHPLLRDSNNQGITTVTPELLEQASDARRQLFDQCEGIELSLSQRQVPVRDIIHIGIGGSVLGTKLLYEAAQSLDSTIKIHFVSNIDAHQLVKILAVCDPVSTIVIGVSKTFSTAETLQNICTVSDWFEQAKINDHWQYFYAVTANYDNAIGFGIRTSNIVTFPQWVGGRYSVWSSVSLSAVLVLGAEKFKEFLAGAALMDQHFYQAKLENNVCFIAASLDHYYTNFMHASSRAIFAYDARLESLVSYLQQLETESNGKDRQLDGDPTDQKTSPVIWGGVGTDVQHSVFQMLHQGTSLIPAEFIMVKKPDHNFPEHHTELLANCIAQSAALLAGQDAATVACNHAEENLSDLALKAKVFSGDRPSSTIVLDQLTPKLLGMLLAFYEHRIFCSGVLANINSFDQMGVELGKRLATQLKPALAKKSVTKNGISKKEPELNSFDQSTQQLINFIRD